jgi:hypothetical protein
MYCTYKVTRKVKFPIPEGNMPTMDASFNSLLHGPLLLVNILQKNYAFAKN